jgi:DnaJ-class molecular chaperone
MVVPQKKQRTEIYTEVCSLCNGKGKVTCSHCGGNRRIESVCSLCKGSGGKMTITCPDCGGSGSADGFWQCMKCNGKGSNIIKRLAMTFIYKISTKGVESTVI